MLVTISDLHFSDGSATTDNISPKAFGIWLEDVLELAAENEATEIIFLYLGDIFDLLRTEHWFYSPGAGVGPQSESFVLGDRPWGNARVNCGPTPGKPSGNCLARARLILDLICNKCRDQLAFLSGDLTKLSESYRQANDEQCRKIETSLEKYQGKIKRYYMPGNHDRLVLHDAALANKALDVLGSTWVPDALGGRHAYKDDAYGVVARHGDEHDVFNFEAHRDTMELATLTPSQYKLVPIGDPITTELMARLPYETYFALLKKDFPRPTATEVYEHLKQLEDVRPLHASLKWATSEGLRLDMRLAQSRAQTGPCTVENVLEATLKSVMARFMKLPFVRQWLKVHDRWNVSFDEADKLQCVARAVKLLSLKNIERALWVWDKVCAFGVDADDTDQGASKEQLAPTRRGGLRYCVYGHTHNFKHEPLRSDGFGGELVYLNTGTWRPRVAKNREGSQFTRFTEIVWVVFYNAQEDRLDTPEINKGTSYDAWHGLTIKRARG